MGLFRLAGSGSCPTGKIGVTMPAIRRAAPHPTALLIDGMGTLVGLDDPVAALRGEFFARHVEITAAEASTALRAEIAFYRAHMMQGRDPEGLARLRTRCAAVLRDALPARVASQAAAIEEMTAVLLGALRFRAFPEAREALLAARRRGARVVVVSNWDVSLPEVLERVGLAPLLDAVVTSAAVGAAKPAPEIFIHALAAAGVSPGCALHVGDSLTEDIAGARACGISAILLRRAPGDPAAPAGVVTIADLAELDGVWPTFPTDA